MRKRLKRFSDKYHYVIHLLIGFFIFLFLSKETIYDNRLLFWCLFGSLAPDIDHLLFYFLYGRKTEYAHIVKTYLRNKEIRNFMKFCILNHKKQTHLYSHNILTPIIALLVSPYFVNSGEVVASGFFVSFGFHYIFDMFEDIFVYGIFNRNWILRFNTKSKVPLEKLPVTYK